MKTYKYIALAAIALGFAACSQEEDFTPQGNQKGAPITIGIDFRPGYGLLFAGHDEDYKKAQDEAKEFGYEYSATAPVYHFFDWTLAATVRYTF